MYFSKCISQNVFLKVYFSAQGIASLNSGCCTSRQRPKTAESKTTWRRTLILAVILQTVVHFQGDVENRWSTFTGRPKKTTYTPTQFHKIQTKEEQILKTLEKYPKSMSFATFQTPKYSFLWNFSSKNWNYIPNVLILLYITPLYIILLF